MTFHSMQLYLHEFTNTFIPRFILGLSPNRFWSQQHWQKQGHGNMHGYNHYCTERPAIAVILAETYRLIQKDASILDLGCNCGYMINRLKHEGYNNITGVDINQNAIEYGKKHFGLQDTELICGSFEDILPRIYRENRKFELVYTIGATVELVHPSFDIIKYLCEISDRYIILIISLHDHSYPRFWEYEFNRHGFAVTKYITPYDSSDLITPINSQSLLVLQKINGASNGDEGLVT